MDSTSLPRWDGHTHSRWCPHGSREPTRRFVRKAVDLGFERYSITEHGPVPGRIGGAYPPDSYTTPIEDLDRCLEEAWELRSEFAGEIEVLPGLEIDFFHGAEEQTAAVVERYGDRLLDALLSVHFLPAGEGFRMVDYSPEDIREGLLPYYGSIDAVFAAYWEAVRASARADFGPKGPRRLGHVGLCWKFRRVLRPEHPERLDPLIDETLDIVARRGFALDIDAAGLRNPDCGTPLPPPPIIERARRRGIPLVFGSDAHAVDHVGFGWKEVAALCRRPPRDADFPGPA